MPNRNHYPLPCTLQLRQQLAHRNRFPDCIRKPIMVRHPDASARLQRLILLRRLGRLI